jgi:hypothetical protein
MTPSGSSLTDGTSALYDPDPAPGPFALVPGEWITAAVFGYTLPGSAAAVAPRGELGGARARGAGPIHLERQRHGRLRRPVDGRLLAAHYQLRGPETDRGAGEPGCGPQRPHCGGSPPDSVGSSGCTTWKRAAAVHRPDQYAKPLAIQGALPRAGTTRLQQFRHSRPPAAAARASAPDLAQRGMRDAGPRSAMPGGRRSHLRCAARP